MIYLWGGSYKSITVLGKENYKQKLQIQQRFGTEENFLHQLPLPDHLSGVVHMANSPKPNSLQRCKNHLIALSCAAQFPKGRICPEPLERYFRNRI
jgi:hypothetical protein